jgi:predicted dehydrogenase
LQVGSQGISSQTQRKAKEFIQSGKLGRVTVIQANYNRNSASGAWIYPIPPDASPQTVNWEMFQGPASKHPFSLERFFRWRCYQEYSGGIATDLFVHLCTTIHYLMDAQMPARVAAMGQLYRWKDSRDVPDTLYGVLEYPEGFTVSLGSTFNNQLSSESSFQILGTEGSLLIGYDSFKFIPERTRENNRWITNAWPQHLEDQYNRDLQARHQASAAPSPSPQNGTVEFKDTGREATELHFESFFQSVRMRTPTVEDVWMGHRAASCAHLINDSVRRGQFVEWDFAANRQKG